MTVLRTGEDTDLSALFNLDRPDFDLPAALTALHERHSRHRWRYLGYPVAYDLDFPHSRQLQKHGFFNNISTEKHRPPGHQHAMEAETAVLDWLCDLFGIDRHRRWGHATTGGTGGNRAALRRARSLQPVSPVLHSRAAHYSVARAAKDFRMPTIEVDTCATGEIDLDALDRALEQLERSQPVDSVIVVATWGTTVTEASDSLAGINTVLDGHYIRQRYIHVDAAIAGIPLALDGAADLTGADSISVSGYKFLAVPEACGMVLGRGTDQDGQVIGYTDTLDVTETGVRSGLMPAMMLESIVQQGHTGHRARAHASRDLADYTIARLADIGVTAWRNPSAYFTVMLPTPPDAVLATWTLANHQGLSHIVCVPGVQRAQIDEFLTDLAAAQRGRIAVPQQRRTVTAAREQRS